MSEPEKRLPRNFHKTFIPERQYIAALLKYVAAGKWGNDQEISDATGIPTGKSSGKVPAIRDYCKGMALIRPVKSAVTQAKQMELTPFGRVVLQEDQFLNESLTQWICHFNLCRPNGGADVWYHVFNKGFASLGTRFSKAALNNYLAGIFGNASSDIFGPLIGMYSDPASFFLCAALTPEKNSANFVRKPAPLLTTYSNAYSAWILQIMQAHFPGGGQVTVSQLNDTTGAFSVPGWNVPDSQYVIELIEQKGAIQVDRNMNPWILKPAATPDILWEQIYKDLI